MKKIIMIICGVLFFIQGCTSQTYMDPKSLETAINNDEFTFMAQKAIPTNYDVINVMNSIPNSTSSRILNLSYGNAVILKKSVLEVNLPYFGRSFSASRDLSKNGYTFTSKDFAVKKNTGKKGKTVVQIETNDQQPAKTIIIEVYKNGKAFVSVNSSDRQPISYDGYIMKNEAVK
ncbi:DUF4251 domain-containing protein [Chryseobacterium sp.]|uniref:DUF4251 domain-containing protein n=1 Tax=Chryseobacterium sp. TaxID=1871047 RepID=UPI0011C7E1A0|nr:DUF4251 domain-containing protein [Chryseobacterium sp.]TXF75862.1 DUF4251 domain-containing protein [Chryseobacterium sp.]